MTKQHHSSFNFWLLQCIGWTPMFGLFVVLFADSPWNSANALLFSISLTCIAMLFCCLLRYLYRTALLLIKIPLLWAMSIFIFSLLASLCTSYLHHFFWWLVALQQPQFSVMYLAQPLLTLSAILFWAYLIWSCLYFAITRQSKLNQLAQQKLQLEVIAKEAHLNTLITQLNPHFMFNAINNIRALILLDSHKAREMLMAFSDLMRHQLSNHREYLVTLKDELTFIDDFIALHSLQLGQRLNFVKQIDAHYTSALIPRMSVQLLIENAIKHAFGEQGVSGTLQLTVAQQADSNIWFIRLQHKGQLKQAKSSSLGLKNLRERLKLYTHYKAYLTLKEEAGYVVATLFFESKP